MPKSKKKPHEMTTDEAMRHLFGKKAHEHMKQVAKEASEKAVGKPKSSIKDNGK